MNRKKQGFARKQPAAAKSSAHGGGKRAAHAGAKIAASEEAKTAAHGGGKTAAHTGRKTTARTAAKTAAHTGVKTAAHTAPVDKNDEVVLDIVGLTHEGEGVGRQNGFTLFVHGALPGERVRAKVLKVKKQYGYAKQLELLSASSDRIEPPCPIYKQCGGCQLQHLSYEAQLAWKRQLVVDNLTRIGKLNVAGSEAGAGAAISGGTIAGAGNGSAVEDTGAASPTKASSSSSLTNAEGGANAFSATGAGILVHPTIGMTEPWRYRNKAQVPIGVRGDLNEGELIGGFYAQGSHRIIDMNECLIQDERNDEIVRIVKQIGRELGIKPYNEETGQGILRHVMARTGYVTGEMMIVLVTNGDRLPRREEWITRIREELPQVTSIVQNVNNRNTNVVFGDTTRRLWGSEVIYDELDGIRFAISARSFYQVNPVQTIALYRKAVEYAGLTGSETVIDAYCGIGTISLFLARKAGRVYGVEIVPEAIEDAGRNAALNGITNASFEAGAAEVVIPRWREEGIVPDVMVVDPPRKGCDEALLDTILAMKPERVVYVSCNPSTLARDLRVLEDGGYRTVEVQPVDMFPHTVHVECCVSLIRK
ncbi:23S rRNA (uracil(1939)-C(5))-methyltransferase RlmD [Paenibacillus protaetiae]|uniref:23S rRNA (Uracil(1939)-C(5))-methyltransferase RlmD n=1 Tax=Paenibacillus protaetiae TaxID=2509456 RepID=A0A4P6EWL7_9BACL|nr:23S rRNA (uracil(1939)-C(5))-methyltransferase RlmD [Paenibacillus protaetiae]QAY67015.1 23S rRNA (uracil(1939)-C(5))-methyltransferase RlmD [Paenibacillus protaetiae]